MRFLFTGHLGCGKSSELHQLRHALANPAPGRARYFPVLFDASEYLDDFDVAPTDILLAIVTEVAARLRSNAGIELKDTYFVKRINEVKQFFLSDVEMNEGELPLWAAKVKVQRLQRDPGARQKVRDALQPQITTMLAEINTVLDAARLALKQWNPPQGQQPYTDLVLILDNLEKVQRLAGLDEGESSQRELFIERAPQLTGIRCHSLFTVPLRLVRSAYAALLQQRYGCAPFVLPTVKVSERGTRDPHAEGLSCLRDLLQKRLHPLTLDGAFTPDALNFLLTYSGGHVRNLVMFVREACAYGDLPLSLEAARPAVGPTVQVYSTSIPETHWDRLAHLDASSDQLIHNCDEDYLLMLENLSVLEYVNGGSSNSAFGPTAERWYAVNPIVRELQKFKAAQDRARKPARKSRPASRQAKTSR